MNGSERESQNGMWVVLTFGEERQYAGNVGYDDGPGKWYSYDSFVANHLRVSEGDYVILCDKTQALGIARIERIVSEPSSRVMQRCPVCKATGIKKRRTVLPEYRCNRGHEFEKPEVENAQCTKFTAHFGTSFTEFSEKFGRDFLRPGYPRYSDQLAMQAFEFLRMEAAFDDAFPKSAHLIRKLLSESYIPAEAAAKGDEDHHTGDGYIPTDVDEREQLFRQIRARRGQRSFRDALRKRYGNVCMISGCRILHVLEAAHVRPYRGKTDNHPENGMLLRSDLHTLFDLDLMGIEPVTLIIHFHPQITSNEYRAFQGKTLSCDARTAPSPQALAIRWNAFQKRSAAPI